MSAAPALKNFDLVQIRLENGPSRGKAFQFEKAPIYFGRDAENDVVMADDVKMSRRHIELAFESNKWIVRNLSMKNVLWVNGKECSSEVIKGPTRILIGESEFVVNVVPMNAMPVLQPTSPPVSIAPRSQKPLASAPKAPPKMPRPPTAAPAPRRNSTQLILIAVIAIGGAAFFMTDSKGTKKAREGLIQSQDQVLLNLEKSEETIREIELKQEKSGQKGLQYQLAQEQFLKGFRDYRQGQFSLAMTSFNAALSLYPAHELARKYYFLSQRKFDQKVQVYMIQGRRYLGKNNYRLCKSSFENVMVMVKDDTKPIYREARQFRNECVKRAEGKF